MLPAVSPPLSARQRALVADTWDFRASAERSAELRLTRLHRELVATEAPTPLCELAMSAREQERRHIGLCDALARRFGWSDEPSEPTAHGPIGPSERGLEDRLLFEMVAFGCVTETVNVAMLVTVSRQVADPGVRETVASILKDEVSHSQLGWGYLQYAFESRSIAWLSAWLPQMFAGAGVDEIYQPDADERNVPELAHFGELSFAQRVEIFRAVAADVILPGFERVQLDTGPCRRWLSRWEPQLANPLPSLA